MKPTRIATTLLIALACAVPAKAEAPRSLYTEINDQACTVLPASGEPGDEEDGLRCKGPAGYELLALSGDLRATVTVVLPEGTEQELKFWDVITGNFSSLGPRAEWRVGQNDVPHALIVRVFAQEDPEHPDRRISWLAVAKITADSACVTDRIAASPDDNERARAAADIAADLPCLGQE